MKDKIFGEVEFEKNIWWRSLDKSLYGSDVLIRVLVQDENHEGILDVQQKAYQTYMENEERYIKEVPRYLLDYYRWHFEEIDKVIELEDDKQKDTITESVLFRMCKVFFLFICRDGSFGWILGCSWNKKGFAVLLSESEPRVLQTRDQLRHLHKLNDSTLGLLVHDGEKAWKGLEQNSFFDTPENLEIELEGSAEEGITPAQQKAYSDYLQKKESYFADMNKKLLTAYVRDEKLADTILNSEHKVVVSTALPKTLYIDKDGNYGWICYTNWDKSYMALLLSEEIPSWMNPHELRGLSSYEKIYDKVFGTMFREFTTWRKFDVYRFQGELQTSPVSVDTGDQKEITEQQRAIYLDYLSHFSDYIEQLKAEMLDYYIHYYDSFKDYLEIPEPMDKEHITRDKVINILSFDHLLIKEDGRLAWNCESPTEENGMAIEWVDGNVNVIIPMSSFMYS
ncbi:MAG: hypothetical protein IK005_03320 [Paludibacteraceae bacterium]|nr:hypothetical protein [Paludibacteraceae bacterium]